MFKGIIWKLKSNLDREREVKCKTLRKVFHLIGFNIYNINVNI